LCSCPEHGSLVISVICIISAPALSLLKPLCSCYKAKTNQLSIQNNSFYCNAGHPAALYSQNKINPLTPELNPSAQRFQTRFFIGDFAS
jgi:hypothetical protein